MEARHLHTDVLIVGGGPAGSAAAISCATRGLSVVVVERDAAAGEKPGDSLHPGIEPLLGQLGLPGGCGEAVGARHRGIWIRWAGPARFEPFGRDEAGPWLGYQVRRAAFDAMLLERARESGATVRRPCRARELVRERDGTWHAATTAGTVRCRIVIDASGGARWLERKRGLRATGRSPRLSARYGYARGSCPERDDAPWLESSPVGWLWTARVGEGLYGWVRVAVGAEPERRQPVIMTGLEPTGPARGADVSWRICDDSAGPGWFVAGDAAARLDPLSSHGILKALMSGMMAGHLSASILSGTAAAPDAEAHYRGWLAAGFATDAGTLAGHYGRLGLTGFDRPIASDDRIRPA